MIWYLFITIFITGLLFGSAASQCDENYIIMFCISVIIGLAWPALILLIILAKVLNYARQNNL